MARLKKALPALAMCAAVLAQFAPVLVGRVYRFEDIAGYFEPLWSAARRQMLAGHFPLWDAGAWSGQPIAGDPQSGVFYPIHWIWCLLPVLRAYALVVAAHAVWGALGMYALCRVRGRSREASALAGLGLGLGAFVVLQVRHVMFVEQAAWTPWVVAAALALVEKRTPRRLALLALSGGMLLATGGVSMIYYGSWFVLVVVGAEVIRRRDARALGWLAAGGALSIAIAAPALWTAAAHGRLSPRALGLTPEFAAEGSWRSYGYAIALALPNPLGDEAAHNYLGGFVQWELVGYYAGVLAFGLSCFAIAARLRRGERRGEAIALVALVVFAAMLAKEGSLAHRIAYRVLPLYAQMRCPARALYVFSLAAPMLSADGIDLLVEKLREGLRRPVLWAAIVIAALDLLATHRHENPTQPLALAERRPPAAAFLVAHHDGRFVNDVHLDHALHNAGLLWGVSGASGYSSVPLWRYLHLLWIANHGAPYPHARIHADLSAQGIWHFQGAIVDELAIRYVLSKDDPGPGWARRLSSPDGIDVWERERAVPGAWVVHRAEVVADEAAAAQAVSRVGFDPRREVVLERAPGLALDGEGAEEAELERRSDTEIAVRARSERAGILVVAEPAAPGWSATVDGSATEILTADLALRAVALPPGSHEVVMRYRSREAERGAAVALAALVACAALLLFRRRATGSAA